MDTVAGLIRETRLLMADPALPPPPRPTFSSGSGYLSPPDLSPPTASGRSPASDTELEGGVLVAAGLPAATPQSTKAQPTPSDDTVGSVQQEQQYLEDNIPRRSDGKLAFAGLPAAAVKRKPAAAGLPAAEVVAGPKWWRPKWRRWPSWARCEVTAGPDKPWLPLGDGNHLIDPEEALNHCPLRDISDQEHQYLEDNLPRRSDGKPRWICQWLGWPHVLINFYHLEMHDLRKMMREITGSQFWTDSCHYYTKQELVLEAVRYMNSPLWSRRVLPASAAADHPSSSSQEPAAGLPAADATRSRTASES